MSLDWERLATAIKAAREQHRWTQQQLADAAQVSFSTVQRLESGDGYSRRPTTLEPVARALEWAPDSVDAVLAGGDPVLEASRAEAGDRRKRSASNSSAAGWLPRRITHELAEGELLDYDVLEFPEGGGKLIVLALSDPSRSAEDEGRVGKDLREWTRVQRRLHGIITDDKQSDTE